jgi:uncharacterized membrane protein
MTRRIVVNKHVKGVLVAAAVAGFFAGSHALAAEGGSGDAAKVKCMGGNECKGKSACAAAGSSCAGENACKGKGWIMTTEADCKAKGGKVVPK